MIQTVTVPSSANISTKVLIEEDVRSHDSADEQSACSTHPESEPPAPYIPRNSSHTSLTNSSGAIHNPITIFFAYPSGFGIRVDPRSHLEVFDRKHRYGKNLRIYYDEWVRLRIDMQFFEWLDSSESIEVRIDTLHPHFLACLLRMLKLFCTHWISAFFCSYRVVQKWS